MSTQFNSDINAAQFNVQSPAQPSVEDETSLAVSSIGTEG
jgi:hypothetical protein